MSPSAHQPRPQLQPRPQASRFLLKSAAKCCKHCGHGLHSANECRFKEATCHICSKVGHIAPVCRSKSNKFSMGQANKSAHYVLAVADGESSNTGCLEEPLFVITKRSNSTCPYEVEIQINKQDAR